MTRPTERAVRNYALHLALLVRRRGSRLVLSERYGQKRQLGAFRTWRAVHRALEQWSDQELARLEEK